jgi:hypothetical protein
VAAAVTILGIIFAVWQYEVAKQDARIAATLGYVTRFGASPVWDSFRNIYLTWLDKDGVELMHTQDQTNRAEKKVDFITTHGLEWDSVVVGDFFDQLYICVIERICSQSIAILMLKRDIEAAYVYANDYLVYKRRRSGGITGCGLAALFSVAEAHLAYERLNPEQRHSTHAPNVTLAQHACSIG